jgi:murein L,D-transpeptidase YafK
MHSYKKSILQCSIALLLLFFVGQPSMAQQNISIQDFKSYQFAAPRVAKAYQDYAGKLQALFQKENFSWPPKDILIRSFKAHNEMEIWVKDNNVDTYRLLKTYPICALSGILGPKRWQGDRQVPEGYYFISDFNPRSDFYLSLMLNYPNYSDLILGNKEQPGGDIYIHGGCVTVGCMPMTNEGIEEIYTLCMAAKLNGQTNIPVHIFPVRFNKNAIDFLSREYGNDPVKQRFWLNLKAGYDYFEKNHKIFPVMYNSEGKYVY